MPSIRQEKLAKLRLEHPEWSKKQLVKAGGYGSASQRMPNRALNAPGTREAYKKYGLTTELVVGALTEDIKKKPQKRTQELTLGAKILGLTDDSAKVDNRSVIINITDDKARRILARETLPGGEE